MFAFLGFLAHYKYLITIVLGVIWVGFIDENNVMQCIKYKMRVSDLKSEISHYDEQTRMANDELQALATNPNAIEKIARERYFMKADDEDIFVLSTDDAQPADRQGNTQGTNEAVE